MGVQLQRTIKLAVIDKGPDHDVPEEEIARVGDGREERESVGDGTERGVLGDEVGDEKEVVMMVKARP